AIADTRINMAKESIMSLTNDVRSGAITHMALAPIDSVSDVERLSQMEYHLALMHLEGGEPAEAAKHFKQSVAVKPHTPFRPIIAFYLEKITGETLEPLPEASDEGSSSEEQVDTPAKKTPDRPADQPSKTTDSSKSDKPGNVPDESR